MADSRIRRSNFNTRQSFSTRVTGPTMHAPRAATAPLFADGTHFGAADVAKGSSIQSSKPSGRASRGAGRARVPRGAGLSKREKCKSEVVVLLGRAPRRLGGSGTGTLTRRVRLAFIRWVRVAFTRRWVTGAGGARHFCGEPVTRVQT